MKNITTREAHDNLTDNEENFVERIVRQICKEDILRYVARW